VRSLGSIDELPRVAGAPSGRGVDRLYDTSLPEGIVYEFPDGTRVWREGGGIRHESPIGRGDARAGTELGYASGTEHGDPRYAGMERAHTLGRGTGFESPFGIFYAPRHVNQEIMNNGIEEFMRGLRDTAAPGEQFYVSTFTAAHAPTRRLREVHYRIEVSRAGGSREVLFEYGITVGNDAAATVTHGVTHVTPDADLLAILDRVDIPARLRARFAARGVRGAIPHAANYPQIAPLIGQPFEGASLPAGYLTYRRTDGRWIIRRPAATDEFQALTVVTRDSDNVPIIALADPRE
jgi:hypothetical protein